MKKITTMCMIALVAVCTQSNAQKIKWTAGEDMPFAKEATMYNVEFDFTDVIVGETSEQEFLNERKAEMNKDKAGEGDEFVTSWQSAKTEKYPKHFIETFNKQFKKGDVVAKQREANAEYTIVVKVTNIKTGKGSAWGKKPAMLDYTLNIVDKSKAVVASGTMEDVKGEVKAPKGSGWIPGGAGTVMSTTAHFVNKEVTNRLAESYELAAIALAKQINKKR